MNKTNFSKKLIVSLSLFSVATLLGASKVYASCDSQYGNCIVNKSFKITKEVRLEGDSKWKDKVVLDEGDKGKTIEFRIKIEFRRKDENGHVVEGEIDGMKMKDSLPDELERIGGSGLTEYWDNFVAGKTKEFRIDAKVKDDEFDTNKTFEKCVVNKAEVTRNKDFEGSDTATVCFGNESEIKELPKTGFDSLSMLSGLGLGSIALGLIIKKSSRLA